MSTTCENYGATLKSLLECLVEKQGVAVADYVQQQIETLTSIHGVDIEALQNAINAINAELDADDSTLAGILNTINEMQTAIQNNTVSISQVNQAVTNAVSDFNTAITNEHNFVTGEISRIEALLHDAYDDSELRDLIAANVTAISGERQERIDAILAVEALVAKNSADIVELKAGLETNAANIAQNATGLAALTSTVNAIKAELEAKIQAVSNCVDSIVSALDSISCDALAAGFSNGLSMGGSSSGL